MKGPSRRLGTPTEAHCPEKPEKKTVKLAALGAILLTAWLQPAPAAADPLDDFFRTGPYVGAGAVLGVENFRARTGGTATAAGAEVRAGYRLTPIFGAELVGEFTDDFAYAPPGPWQQVRIWSVSANLKASANLRRLRAGLGRVQPYAVIGVGYYQAWLHGTKTPTVANRSVRDGMARLGVGVDVYLSGSLLLSLEGRYNALFDARTALDYWSFGLGPQLRF